MSMPWLDLCRWMNKPHLIPLERGSLGMITPRYLPAHFVPSPFIWLMSGKNLLFHRHEYSSCKSQCRIINKYPVFYFCLCAFYFGQNKPSRAYVNLQLGHILELKNLIKVLPAEVWLALAGLPTSSTAPPIALYTYNSGCVSIVFVLPVVSEFDHSFNTA